MHAFYWTVAVMRELCCNCELDDDQRVSSNHDELILISSLDLRTSCGGTQEVTQTGPENT